MVTEREISLRWRELFRGKAIDEAVFTKASELIEALPATSPLRQRYTDELADLRRLHAPTDKPKSKSPAHSRSK